MAKDLLSECIILVHLKQIQTARVTLFSFARTVLEQVPLELISLTRLRKLLTIGEDATLHDQLFAVFLKVNLSVAEFVKF